jgi:hypothetical protein
MVCSGDAVLPVPPWTVIAAADTDRRGASFAEGSTAGRLIAATDGVR